jgi:hypothetical protein
MADKASLRSGQLCSRWQDVFVTKSPKNGAIFLKMNA